MSYPLLRQSCCIKLIILFNVEMCASETGVEVLDLTSVENLMYRNEKCEYAAAIEKPTGLVMIYRK